MNISYRVWIRWAGILFLAVSGAYAFSVHYLGFIGASRSEKLFQLGVSLVVSGLVWVMFARLLIPRITTKVPRNTFLKFIFISSIIAAAALLLVSQPPPFPEQHTLEIQVMADKSGLGILEKESGEIAGGVTWNLDDDEKDMDGLEELDTANPEITLELQRPVQIISIERVNYPRREIIGIDPGETVLSGSWQVLPDNTLLWEGGKAGVLRYEAFMQAGIDLVFRSGPAQGIVKISWDGNEQVVDLAQHPAPTHTEHLKPGFTLANADTTRRILAFGALAADLITLTGLLSIICLFLYIILKDRVIIRNPRLLAAGSLVLIGLLIPVYIFIQPVSFPDSNLDAVIRSTLSNPDRPIYRHQLLTIASLDGYHKYIRNLEGIHYLSNLSELNLRRNLVEDLTPLSKLKHLTKLNLRENQVTDVSPLVNNTSLVYLNLDSNSGITTLTPLTGLTNLETLILAEVPVGKEIELLDAFLHLKRLNLRYCGISDLSPLAGMTSLESVNLYGNYRIQTIEPLADLHNLHTLILGEVPAGDEAALLVNLTKLQHLNLRKTGIKDLSPLSKLTRLTYLNLHSNPDIGSIIPISRLKNLRTLILENVPVGDQVAILANYPSLVQLNLQNTGVTDVGVIEQLLVDGAFKDDPHTGEKSSINLTGNPLAVAEEDAYAPLRPFWEDISLRDPYVFPQFSKLSKPAFSDPAGFYGETINLELSTDETAASIHYTLDGSEPTLDSPLYTQPILIENLGGIPNRLSANSQISPYWKNPDGEVFKAVIIKARVFGDQPDHNSRTETRTYFIGNGVTQRYSLPVISLVSDEDFFFGYKNGIYIKGLIYDQNYSSAIKNLANIDANYFQKGMVWERPVHLEIFTPDGEQVYSRNGGMHIHGHATPVFPQKSLRIFARSEYDTSEVFDFDFFPGLTNRIDSQPVQQFDNFILRNSGNDWDQAFMRDALMHKLVSHTSLDTQAYQPVVVFINGEYWGIHDLRQRLDEEYLASMYLADPGHFDILDFEVRRVTGDAEVVDQYTKLLDYMETNNLQEQAIYEYIQTQIDLENYLDYVVAEVYSANADWPHNNVRLWRFNTGQFDPDALPGQDGRWRWMLFDTDLGMGLLPVHGSYVHPTLEIASAAENKDFLLSSLFRNENFKIHFINRAADQLNTTFREEHVLEIINQMQAVLFPEMEEHIRRWRTMGDSIQGWEQNVDVLREFARKRPEYLRRQIIEKFGLPGMATLTIRTDPKKGYIQVNSIEITDETPGVENPGLWSGEYFAGIPVQVKAVPYPGFRFTGWEGTDSISEVISISMQDSLTIQALFEPVQ